MSTSKLVERLVASVIATFPANLVKIPAEVIKQRAQLTQSSDIIRIIADATRGTGLRGLYVGGYGEPFRNIAFRNNG